jgi:hypothetical protein
MMRKRSKLIKVGAKKGTAQQTPTKSRRSLGNILKTYSNKLKYVEEMDKLPDIYDHPKLNQKDINHLKTSITNYEI